ncbi:MAG: glycosyltransferase family 39 protein [bacterium]
MNDSINYTELKTHKKSKYLYLLISLVLFHVVFNLIWIILNNQPPTWDAAYHTTLSFQMYSFAKEAMLGLKIKEFLLISNYYPPFTHIFGTFLITILGYSYKILQFSGTIFFSIALVFIYLYTKELFKSERIAFFSAFFYSFFILVFQQSKFHMLDIPLTALVFMSLFFLLKSNNLTNRKFSLFFFIFAGLAFLTKWYAVIFIMLPFIYCFSGLFKRNVEYKKILKNILIGLTLFLIITLPWYVVNLKFLISSLLITSTPELSDPQNLFSLNNFLFYLKQTIMFQTSSIGFIFFMVSLYLLLKNKSNKNLQMVIFTLIFTYIIFTIIGNKNIRFLIPLMPFVAMIMGYGAHWIFKKGKFFTTFLLSITITYLCLSYFVLSFGIPIYPSYKYAVNLPVIKWTDIYYLHTYPVKAIYEPKQKLPYLDIVKEIEDIKIKNLRVLMLADSEYINNGIITPQLYANSINNIKNFDFVDYDLLIDKNIQNFLDINVDVIVVSKNYLGLEEGIREYKDLERFHKFTLSGSLKNFEKVKEYSLVGDEYHPDDIIILLQKVVN